MKCGCRVVPFSVSLLFTFAVFSGPLTDNPAYGQIRGGCTVRLGGYFYACWQGANGAATVEQLAWMGSHLDVVIADQSLSPGAVRRLRSLNAGLRYYLMTFGTTLAEPVYDPATMSSWVVRTLDGNEAIGVRHVSHDSKFHLMSHSSQAWADFYRRHYGQAVAELGADGVAIDEIMWKGYWNVKSDSIQGIRNTDDVTQACYQWLSRIGSDRKFEIIHQAYWDSAQVLSDGIWGEMAFQSHFSDQWRVIWYRAGTWKDVVENLDRISSLNRTYVWAAWYDRDSIGQFKYCLATFLMGLNGRYAVFQPQPRYGKGYPSNLAGYDLATLMKEYEKYQTLIDVDLGTVAGKAKEVATEEASYWFRPFTKGFVLCNPSETRSTVVELPRPMRLSDGRIDCQVRLGPRSGEILLY